jgi:EAL domain-containing protein (putative c-di-GMP-specific phosphodiesterase class I)
MQTLLDQRTVLENALRKAIESQQLHLYYQVQVDSLNRPIGAEVLLRWEHPEQGCLTPGSFMEIAEESGLILPIGLWVLVTACVQLNLWQASPLAKQLILAVNVSAKQFHQPDFVAQVERALWETGAPASLLKLELTESIVLENIQDTIIKMDQLKHLGVSIAIDDFGTGYSSLQYLKELPLNQIKIDQSFVRDIDDPKDAAIVQAIIVMTEKLGLNVIAEGVETHAQRDFLERAGCHHYQGYLFSKPIPLQAFEALLQTWSSAGHSQ